MPRNSPPGLTIDDIFRAVKHCIDTTSTTGSSSDPSTTATTNVNQEEAFDNALHQLVNTPRTKTVTDVQALCTTLSELTRLCADDSQRWATWVLALIHKRYHLKSPQAQQEVRQNDDDDDDQDKDAVLAGDGERLLFYVSVLFIFYYALQENNGYSSSAVAAVQVLCQVAPWAGGTRDVCSLLELFLRALLDGYLLSASDSHEHSSTFVAKGLQEAVTTFQVPGAVQALTDMLDLMATTLESDLEIVTTKKTPETDVTMQPEPNTDTTKGPQHYPSTFHVFLPHHDRGKGNKKRKHSGANSDRMTNRTLVQSVAEILIWSHTLPADDGIQSAYKGLLEHSIKDDGKNQVAKTYWHRIQTIARKKRQMLNSYARDRGFLLANQFSIDAAAICMSQIKQAKAADLNVLTRLASKKGNQDILKLVSARFAANPNKTPAAASVSELISRWVFLEKQPEANEEVYQLESHIQRAKVRATLQTLRLIRPDNVSKQVKIMCLGPSKLNKAAAVLLKAALCENLILDDEPEEGATTTVTTTTTLSHVMARLDAVAAGTSGEEENDKDIYFPSMRSVDGTATTKAVMNFLERHVADNTAVLFLTSANLRLPADEMKKLVNRGVTVHCHDADDIGSRLDREKAKSGDVTISLAWDTQDDLDLHVTMPSGEELYYGNKVSNCNKGILDVDMNACGPYSKEPVENVFLGSLEDEIQAPSGKYIVVVQNYAYHTPGSHGTTKIPWRVRIQANGVTTNYEGSCVGSGSSSNARACEFEYQGRTIPFPQQLEDQSAFGTANLVGVTSSTGQTLESLRNLMKVTWELQELDRVRQLMHTEEGDPEHAEENGGAMDVEETKGPERPTVAKHLEVTSRDRLNMVLCRLPARFHQMISRAFGTESLIRTCSIQVARSMLKDNIPLLELEESGYPPDVVSAVKDLMKKGAVPAA